MSGSAPPSDSGGLTRRDMLLLGGGMGAAIALGGSPGLVRTAAAHAAARRTTLRVGIPNDIGGWDFDFVSFDNTTIMTLKNVYPFAIDYGLKKVGKATIADVQRYVPVFAESFKPDKSQKIWTLRMRRGLTWPSGNPMTAVDVKWSKDRAFAANANVAGIYRLIGLTDPDQVELVDDRTLRFHQAFPTVLTPQIQIISLFIFDSVLAKQQASANDPWAKAWANATPQEGGAFNVASRQAGQSVLLEANPEFPGRAPSYKRIDMSVITSPANMRLQLQKGDIDLALGLSPRDIRQLRSARGVRIISVPSNEMVVMELNVKSSPLNKVLVRRALAHAVPYEQIISLAFSGEGRLARSVVSADQPGFIPSYPYDYDVAKAKSLLAKAGLRDGFDSELVVAQGDPIQEQVAILLQNAFKQIGVDLEIASVDPATLSTRRQKKNIPMQIITNGPWINDIEYQLSIALTKGAFLNHSDYVNPTVEKIFARLHKTVDPAKRRRMSQQVQRILARDLPWIPLGQPNLQIPVRGSVSNYVIAPDLYARFQYMR